MISWVIVFRVTTSQEWSPWLMEPEFPVEPGGIVPGNTDIEGILPGALSDCQSGRFKSDASPKYPNS